MGEKKKKLIEMMNSTPDGMPAGTGMPSGMPPFTPPNLFGPKPPMSSPMAMFQEEKKDMVPPINKALEDIPVKKEEKPTFDVDELVRKIDAKIAELEKEEERNKEQLNSKPKKEIQEEIEVLDTPSDHKKEEKKVNLSLEEYDDVDDDFFDDFFDE